MVDSMDWRQNLIDDDDGIRNILEAAKNIAVIGIKDAPGSAGYYIPHYMHDQGYEIIPVTPKSDRVFGLQAYPALGDVPDDVEIDIVQIFRRPEFVRGHADEALARKPQVFWTQSGIVDWDSAELLARAGIKVVMDRCMMVDHQTLLRRGK